MHATSKTMTTSAATTAQPTKPPARATTNPPMDATVAIAKATAAHCSILRIRDEPEAGRDDGFRMVMTLLCSQSRFPVSVELPLPATHKIDFHSSQHRPPTEQLKARSHYPLASGVRFNGCSARDTCSELPGKFTTPELPFPHKHFTDRMRNSVHRHNWPDRTASSDTSPYGLQDSIERRTSSDRTVLDVRGVGHRIPQSSTSRCGCSVGFGQIRGRWSTRSICHCPCE